MKSDLRDFGSLAGPRSLAARLKAYSQSRPSATRSYNNMGSIVDIVITGRVDITGEVGFFDEEDMKNFRITTRFHFSTESKKTTRHTNCVWQ